MEHIFKLGDKVKLKSGSPTMTIASYHINGSATVHCHWYNEPTNEIKKIELPEISLEKVD